MSAFVPVPRPALMPAATLEDCISQLQDIDECPICAEFYRNHDHIATRIPQCKHIMGRSCLLKWLATDMPNSHTCPVCRAVLWDRPVPDDENEDEPMNFMQRLWATLWAGSSDGELTDEAIDTLLESLDWRQVPWLDMDMQPMLHRATRTMYHAIGLGTLRDSDILNENCLRIWYRATVDFRLSFAWDEVSQAIDELRLNNAEQETDPDMLDRFALLDWLTMRLIRDVGDTCRYISDWPVDMPDERIKSRIRELGAMLANEPSEKTLEHVVKVVKLLHRFHYPVTAPFVRDVGVTDAKHLKWLWLGAESLLVLFPFKISSAAQVVNYDNLLAKPVRFSREISQCFLNSWNEIVALQVSADMDSALQMNASLTDNVLVLVLRFCATERDLWSHMNIQEKDVLEDVVSFYRHMAHGGLKTLRLFSRIISRGIMDYKKALEMEATTDEEQTLRNAQIAATKPHMERSLMEPFVRAFIFPGLEPEQRIDRALFFNTVRTPENYGNAVWWMVAMLCREDWSVWGDNLKPHIRDLINTWAGATPSIPTDVSLVFRLEAVVAYILQHCRQENRLVTGKNDKQEALWIFTESAAPRYRPAVQE